MLFLLPIILSLGAVYAFIPVIIIIILLLAARGSIGKGMFDMFAMSSIIGSARGIGGGGAGRGLHKARYPSKHSKTMEKAASGLGDTFLNKKGKAKQWSDKIDKKTGEKKKRWRDYFLEQEVQGRYGLAHKKSDRIMPTKDGKGYKYSIWARGGMQQQLDLEKMNIMTGDMKADPKEIRNMLKEYGKGDKADNISNENLIKFAVYELSLKQIRRYREMNIKNSGSPGPMQGPRKREGAKDAVKMAVDFYKTYTRTRSRHIVTYREANDIMMAASSLSTAQLSTLLSKRGIRITPDMDKGKLMRLAVTAVSLKEIEDFVNKNRSRQMTGQQDGDERAEPKVSGQEQQATKEPKTGKTEMDSAYEAALKNTNYAKELTDPKVAEFVAKLPHDAAMAYLYAMNSKSIGKLTDEKTMDFASKLEPDVAASYFVAMTGTNSASELTSDKVMDFASKIGPEKAKAYFESVSGTKAVNLLTDDRLLSNADFVSGLGKEAAISYMNAIASTKSIDILTSKDITNFASSIGDKAANAYFLAVRSTGSADKLSDKRVLSFASRIGPEKTELYFLAMADTKAVTNLTDDKVLSNSDYVSKLNAVETHNYFFKIASGRNVRGSAGTQSTQEGTAGQDAMSTTPQVTKATKKAEGASYYRSKKSFRRFMEDYIKGNGKGAAPNEDATDVAQDMAAKLINGKFLGGKGWKFDGATRHWIEYKKGEYYIPDRGYSNKVYKIFIQPKAEYFDKARSVTSKTLSDLVDKKVVTGAVFKFLRSRKEFGGVIEDETFSKGPQEKIVIYTSSKEDMEKVVKGLNGAFGANAYKYGSENNLDTYDKSHGARFTYGISPLIHVRRGGMTHHEDMARERRIRGEDASKPPADWSIPAKTVNELRKDSLKYKSDK